MAGASASSDLAALAKRLQERGQRVTDPLDGARIRPAGEELAWRTLALEAAFEEDGTDPIPFFIRDRARLRLAGGGSMVPRGDGPDHRPAGNPSSVRLFYLRVVGRGGEAVLAHRRAIDEDPLNLVIRVGHAVSLRAAGRDDEAADEARRIMEINPEFTAAYTLQAPDVTTVPPDEALAYAEKGVAQAPLAAALHRPPRRRALEAGPGTPCPRFDGRVGS